MLFRPSELNIMGANTALAPTHPTTLDDANKDEDENPSSELNAESFIPLTGSQTMGSVWF